MSETEPNGNGDAEAAADEKPRKPREIDGVRAQAEGAEALGEYAIKLAGAGILLALVAAAGVLLLLLRLKSA